MVYVYMYPCTCMHVCVCDVCDLPYEELLNNNILLIYIALFPDNSDQKRITSITIL